MSEHPAASGANTEQQAPDTFDNLDVRKLWGKNFTKWKPHIRNIVTKDTQRNLHYCDGCNSHNVQKKCYDAWFHMAYCIVPVLNNEGNLVFCGERLLVSGRGCDQPGHGFCDGKNKIWQDARKSENQNLEQPKATVQEYNEMHPDEPIGNPEDNDDENELEPGEKTKARRKKQQPAPTQRDHIRKK